MDLHRKREKTLRALADRFRCGPWHDEKDRVRLDAARTTDGGVGIAVEGFALHIGRGLRLDRRQEVAPDDIYAETLRLVASDEIAVMLARADQQKRLGGHY